WSEPEPSSRLVGAAEADRAVAVRAHTTTRKVRERRVRRSSAGDGPASTTLGAMARGTRGARASAEQLHACRAVLRDLAGRHGLSNLRLAADGTLFVHVDDDPGYRRLLDFVADATAGIGAEPNVVTDETPAAATKLPTASAL